LRTNTSADVTRQLDTSALELKVKAMYRDVALAPHGEFHFEMGRGLALRLGYAPADLDAIPSESIDSFAGVGYYFDLAGLQAGETVVDIGSGSGMDSFIAARKVGSTGAVIGIDMTDEQLAKAERLRAAAGFGNVTYRKGYIEATGLADESCDAVISNGVINLAPAELPKQAASFDLPITLGILAGSGQIASELFERYAVVGELALDGSMRPVSSSPCPASAKATSRNSNSKPERWSRSSTARPTWSSPTVWSSTR